MYFNVIDLEEKKKCSHYTNLQPMLPSYMRSMATEKIRHIKWTGERWEEQPVDNPVDAQPEKCSGKCGKVRALSVKSLLRCVQMLLVRHVPDLQRGSGPEKGNYIIKQIYNPFFF
jgi:hypothetical protein